MSKVALIVEYTAKAGCRGAFLELLLPHAAASREEPGTLRFDVLFPGDDPDRLVLYELYADQAAYEFHAGTERLKNMKAAAADLIAERKGSLWQMHDAGGL